MSYYLEDEKNDSYFVNHRQLVDVVACPGVVLPSLANSCHVPIDEILDLDDEEDEEIGEPAKTLIKTRVLYSYECIRLED